MSRSKIINYCSPRRFYINNRMDPMARGMGVLVTYNFVDLLESLFEYSHCEISTKNVRYRNHEKRLTGIGILGLITAVSV